MPLAIWWIRRDLRLRDNPALLAALAHGQVLPVFIKDPALLNGRYHRAAARRQAFLFNSLKSLDRELAARGSRLTVRHGAPEVVLGQLVQETGADLIVASEDYSPSARRRDARVQAVLPLTLTNGPTVHHPLAVQKKGGGPYTVYTPFSKAWKALPLPEGSETAPAQIPAPTIFPLGDALVAPAPPDAFAATEDEALGRLDRFVAGSDAPVLRYAAERDSLALNGTSTLSPYLRFGLLSPRTAARAAIDSIHRAPSAEAARQAGVWLNQLVWREFYEGILYHFPHVLTSAFNPALRDIVWREAPGDFEAWKAGRTGMPIVDAGMRQLAELGWMHNRARMIVASFLVKDLLIDWQLGEQWFMEQLVDGDPANNNGGWQWTAGVGTDAAPYFRIFNSALQGQKFDPTGDYIRRYVPELASVPDRRIHEPWTMSPEEQHEANVRIGHDYPALIVDRALARERVLNAYRLSKDRHATS